MSVIFQRIGNTAIFSADAETRTKQGILEVNFVESERVSQGRVSGVMQISLNGKPLVIISSSGKPKSCRCNCITKGIRQKVQVFDRKKLRELGPALTLVFRKLNRELVAVQGKKSAVAVAAASAAVPCFIRIPICRLAYSQYIIACRLRGRNAQECLQEADLIYKNCKGNC